MQETGVVLGVLRERGRKGLPCTQLYRQMFNRELYLTAYGNIYSNQGAMTPGANEETADGMSEEKIEQIIGLMRNERYRFSPARRIYIPKKNGRLRPLGLPSWSDKLVGEVVRLLLEAIYEPQFSRWSHGFRRNRGCHTALRDIQNTWTGTTWFIEGDISDCFGSLDHEILLRILAEKIHDQRFLRLIRNMLKAGYLEDWEYRDSLSGCPQGGVVSPILSNVYLDKLDKFVEQELIPQYTRGTRRKCNPEYDRIQYQLARARKRGDRAAARDLEKQLRSLPASDPMDPGYRRLKYTRYADDHILGFIGPKAEAEEIKAKLAKFLRETLGLELNQQKTLITHARSQHARFLGYDITVQHSRDKITGGRRTVNGTIALRVPRDVIKAQTARYRRRGKPSHRPRLQNLDDYDIVPEIRGRVRRRRQLLPACPGRLPADHPAVERRIFDAEDAGPQAPQLRCQDGGPSQGQDRDQRRAADLLRGQKAPRGQEGPGSTIRRDHPAAGPAGGHPRPRARPGSLPPQGARQEAPNTGMRALRDRHHGDSPPGHRPQNARETGTGPACVGRAHGENAAQDAHRLRAVP